MSSGKRALGCEIARSDTKSNVKLADFGAAQSLNAICHQNSEFAGTIHYMAPEVNKSPF